MNNYQNRKNFLFTNAVPKTPKPKSAVPEMDIIPKTVRHKTFTTLANETKNLILPPKMVTSRRWNSFAYLLNLCSAVKCAAICFIMLLVLRRG